MRVSVLLALLCSALAAVSTVAFAPTPAFKTGALPSAASSTALGVKIKVVVGDGEPIESALRRFKREVNKSGHLMDLRYKRYFENSQEKRKRKIVQARIRRKFERMQRKRNANRT